MNQNLKKCLPIFAVAFALSACGNDPAAKKDGGPAGITATKLSTQFEADCGADAAAAAAATEFDLTACNLNSRQVALLQEVGPFKVEADCVRHSVRIKNGADQISGEGSIKDDGTFSVPLTVGPRFAQLDSCPVRLQGLATGKVTCDEENHLVKVDVNTAFNFEAVTAETSALALEFATLSDASQGGQEKGAIEPKGKGDQEQPGQEEPKGKGDQELPGQEEPKGKGDQEQPGQEEPKGKGDQEMPGQEAPKGKGDQESPGQELPGKGDDKGEQELPGKDDGKGEQELPKQDGGQTDAGKGKQDGGQQGPIPGSNVSCVKFNPCAFVSNASLSCSR